MQIPLVMSRVFLSALPPQVKNAGSITLNALFNASARELLFLVLHFSHYDQRDIL